MLYIIINNYLALLKSFIQMAILNYRSMLNSVIICRGNTHYNRNLNCSGILKAAFIFISVQENM